MRPYQIISELSGQRPCAPIQGNSQATIDKTNSKDLFGKGDYGYSLKRILPKTATFQLCALISRFLKTIVPMFACETRDRRSGVEQLFHKRLPELLERWFPLSYPLHISH